MQPLPHDGAAPSPYLHPHSELVLQEGLPARRPLFYIEAYVLWLAEEAPPLPSSRVHLCPLPLRAGRASGCTRRCPKHCHLHCVTFS